MLALRSPTLGRDAGRSLADERPTLGHGVARPLDGWQGAVKRGLDIVIALLLLPALAPLLLAVAIAIRVTSPGPVLFRQWRFGLGGRPTRILMFRTLQHTPGDAPGELRTRRRDPRVTAVGRVLRRTSIDELPQLLNVLRGDMSLVGPRPHAPHMKVGQDFYFDAVKHYHLRHRIRPGMTGWAQVTGSRGEVDTIEKAEERLQKDLWYLWNWSLGLDLQIMARTILGGFMSMRAD